jgi:hypothetical protein
MLSNDNIVKFLNALDISRVLRVNKLHYKILTARKKLKQSFYFSGVPSGYRKAYWMQYSAQEM